MTFHRRAAPQGGPAGLLVHVEHPALGAGVAAGANRRDLLLAAAAPRHCKALGDEVVAGVPVLHLDHVTGATEPGDLVRENQLRHISPYLPAPA